MPRPEGFVDAQVPALTRGEPWPDRGGIFLVDLGVALAFGLAMGCLIATWRGRDMARLLLFWGGFWTAAAFVAGIGNFLTMGLQ